MSPKSLQSNVATPLLQALDARQEIITEKDDRYWGNLREIIIYLYRRKCLLTYINLPTEKAISYAWSNVSDLATRENYNELERLISQYSGQIDSQKRLLGRQAYLVAVVVESCLVYDRWPERRQLILNGIDWLRHPAAELQFTMTAENESQRKPLVDWTKFLISLPQQKDFENEILDVDISWLTEKAYSCQPVERIIYLKQAISLLNGRIDKHWATLHAQLGDTYRKDSNGDKSENLESAIQAYHHVLQERTQKNNPIGWASIKYNLGACYEERKGGDQLSNLDLSIKAYNDALKVFTRKDNLFEWAATQSRLGLVYQARALKSPQSNRAYYLDESLNAYLKALQAYDQENSPLAWASIQHNIGVVYQSYLRGDQAKRQTLAIEAYQKALSVYTQKDYPIEWASAQYCLISVHLMYYADDPAKNHVKAFNACRNALKIYTKEKMPLEWAATQNRLGGVYSEYKRGDKVANLDQAITAFNNALEIYNKEDNPLELALINSNLGKVYFDKANSNNERNLTQSIEAYQRALQVYRADESPLEWARVQNNLGNAYSKHLDGNLINNQKEAVGYYSNTFKIYSQKYTPHQWALVQNNLGNLYTELSEGDEAENHILAIEAYNNSLQVWTRDYMPSFRRLAKLSLGDLFYKKENWAAARDMYAEVHCVIELLRGNTVAIESRRRLTQENTRSYTRLVHCSLKLNDIEAAAGYAMAGKSRTLTEQLALASERTTLDELLAQQPALAQEYEPIRQHQQELDGLLILLTLPPVEGDDRSAEKVEQEQAVRVDKISWLRQIVNKMTDDLVFAYPALSAVKPLPPIQVDQAQTLAVELGNVPLVEYVAHAGGWGAFVITAETVNYVALANDLLQQIASSLQLFLKNGKEGTRFWLEDDWPDRLIQLYELVFAPLLLYLPSSGDIVLSPTQALHLVPFQALCRPDGTFISEDYAFSFVPSLATLRVLHEQHKRSQTVEPVPNRLLNIAYSGSGESKLDNVGPESEAVGSQFAEPLLLSEGEAIVERVIEEANKRPYQVVHFNCHGSFQSDSPAHSGLALADHRITINDIRIRIRLQGRPLVTLSACQTGQTLPEQGDETTGISWAFLAAGASATLSSQWSVPDASTRDLFTHFYQLRRQLGVSDA